MSRKVIIQRRAELEMNRAVIWYEEKRAGLGREFIAEFRASLRKIADVPTSFPTDFRYARRAILDRFPYKIYFVVGTDDLSITVVAVLHVSQSKSRLRGRF